MGYELETDDEIKFEMQNKELTDEEFFNDKLQEDDEENLETYDEEDEDERWDEEDF